MWLRVRRHAGREWRSADAVGVLRLQHQVRLVERSLRGLVAAQLGVSESAPPVHVATVLGGEHCDYASVFVDVIQHPVAATASSPSTLKFALQRLPDSVGCTQEVAGDELGHCRRDRLRQVVGDVFCGRPGDPEPVRELRYFRHHLSAGSLVQQFPQSGLVDDVTLGDRGFTLAKPLHSDRIRQYVDGLLERLKVLGAYQDGGRSAIARDGHPRMSPLDAFDDRGQGATNVAQRQRLHRAIVQNNVQHTRLGAVPILELST